MIRKMLNRYCPGTEVVILCRTLDGGAETVLLQKMFYLFHMFVQMFHLATSQVVILDTYCIAVSLLHHKKNLTVIQMWHSMGTMKKFGYAILDKAEGIGRGLAYAMKMHRNYDYIFASADAYKEDLARGFNCDIKKIITMPLPRLDLLKSAPYASYIRKKIYNRYPELEKRDTILYCPTFRKQEKELKIAADRLIRAINLEKYNLIIKPHPLSTLEVSDDVVLAKEFSSFEMLFAADYVVSDYSCIVYEAAIRDIPIFFYNFDMESYVDSRGLAIDYYKELPGVITADAAELAEAIEKPYDIKELRRFAEKYVHLTEHATKDIVDFINKFLV